MTVRCVGEVLEKQSHIALNVGIVYLIKPKIINVSKILPSQTVLFVFRSYSTRQKGIFLYDVDI